MATPVLTIQQARQDIRDALKNNFSQDTVEGSVPSAQTLKRVAGAVYPYIVYRFSDAMPSLDTSMAGPQGDGLIQMVTFMAIAPDAATVESIYMKILYNFIGFTPSWSGPMTKRGGAGTFPLGSDSGAEEAFITSANFVFTTTAMPVSNIL